MYGQGGFGCLLNTGYLAVGEVQVSGYHPILQPPTSNLQPLTDERRLHNLMARTHIERGEEDQNR